MKFREIFLLAFEALANNKLRSLLTMLGMIIGVGAVVLLVSIGNGARNYITAEFEGMGSNLLIIQPGKTDKKQGFGPPIQGGKPLTIADSDAIERLSNNVDASTGILFGASTVKSEEASANVSVFGSNSKFFRIFNFKMGEGDAFTDDRLQSKRVAVLGYEVAQTLFGNTSPIGRVVKVNESEHRVVGVGAKMGNSLGLDMDQMVYITTESAMKIFNTDNLMGIRARAKSRNSVDDAVAEITEILTERHGEEDFTVMTQGSMLATMNTILGMLTYVLGGIAMISMIVGGIGIMNIMLVSVTERTREIGIRRAVGARQRDILRQFLAEALALSLVGGMIGLAGSTFLTYLVSWSVDKFDMRAPVWILIPAFGISTLIGIVFGVWPAKKAAKIETIDALRYE